MASAYLALKLLHVLAVVVFLGNVTFGLYWARRALARGSAVGLADAFDDVARSDRWFTLPGVAAILATGFATAAEGGLPVLGTGWILWALGLFAVSGVAFVAWVAPLQRRIAGAARAGDLDAARALFRRWEAWGAVALATPFLALALMVLKPGLPAL